MHSREKSSIVDVPRKIQQAPIRFGAWLA